MREHLTRYGSLFVAALLFIAGAMKYHNDVTGTAFLTAGLVMLGCWVTLEVMYTLRTHDRLRKMQEDAHEWSRLAKKEGSEDATD